MATVTESSLLEPAPPGVIAAVATATVTTAATDLISLPTRGKTRAVFEIANTGANLTALKVYGRVKGGAWLQLAGQAGADYTTPIGVLVTSRKASDNSALDITTLNTGVTAVLVLTCQGFDDVKLAATCGTTTSVVTMGQAA